MERAIHAALAIVACLIALAVAALLALTAFQVALKASENLRSYRPDGPRLSAAGDGEIPHSVGILNR